MNCVSCDICVYDLWFVCVLLPGVFLSSRVTRACPVTTDLIMRVNVRTTVQLVYYQVCSNTQTDKRYEAKQASFVRNRSSNCRTVQFRTSSDAAVRRALLVILDFASTSSSAFY